MRELENIMHRAVLMAQGNTIDDMAILLPIRKDVVPASATVSPISPLAVPGTTAPAPTASASQQSGGQRNELVGRTVDDVEKELILDTLSHCLGNRTQAAQVLGISIRTLRNKLKIYNEEGPLRSKTGS